MASLVKDLVIGCSPFILTGIVLSLFPLMDAMYGFASLLFIFLPHSQPALLGHKLENGEHVIGS